MFAYKIVAPLGVSIRTAPDVSSKRLGVNLYGKIVYGTPEGDWLKLGSGGYSAIWWKGVKLLDLAWGKIRCIVLHDIERCGLSRPEINNASSRTDGLPETCKFVNSNQISLTKELQEYWFDELKKRNPNMSESARKLGWKSMTRGWAAVTNKFGSDKYADYINGTNLNVEPMKLEPIVMGGTILTMLGRERVYGEHCYKVLTDSAKVQTGLFYTPVNSRRDRTVIAFSQFDNPIVPIMTKDKQYNYIPQNRVRILEEGETPSPFL